MKLAILFIYILYKGVRITIMKKNQTTSRGFAILSFAGILNKLLAVIYIPMLTHIISNFGNGIYNAAYQMYALVFAITNAGVPIAISKLVSEQIALGNYEDSQKTLKVSSIILISIGLLMTVLTALFAKTISIAVSAPRSYLSFLALSPAMTFTAIASTFRGYFQGRSNMTPSAISQVIEQFLNSIFTVVLAYIFIKYGINAACAGGAAGSPIGSLGSATFLVLLYFAKRKEFKEEVKSSNYVGPHMNDKDIAKKIIGYAFPIILGTIAINTSNIIDLKFTMERLVVAGFSGHHASVLYGILTTQYQKLLFIPMAITYALAAAIIPGISSANAVNNKELLYEKIQNSLRIISIITIPAAVGLAVLAKPVITILFTHKYNQGSNLMVIGSCVLVLMSIVQIQTSILQGIGKTHIPAINMVIGLIAKIVINYNLIAIHRINIRGAVIGNIICYLLTAILNQLMIRKHTGISLNYPTIIIKPLIASSIMGLLSYYSYYIIFPLISNIVPKLYLTNLISTVFSAFIGGITFIFILILIKGISKEDIQQIPHGNIVYKIPLLKNCF